MTTEEKIAELETSCKAMTEEIEKLKAEFAKKTRIKPCGFLRYITHICASIHLGMFIVQFWKVCHQRNSE